MRRFLTLISLFLVLVLRISTACAEPEFILSLACPEFIEGKRSACAQDKEYNLLMQVRGKEISGICLMNLSDDNTAVGTVVNEFGVKVFDFKYDGKRAKVLNVFKPLDKWYIRKVLNGDFTFIITSFTTYNLPLTQHPSPITYPVTKGKRTLSVGSNGDIIVRNDKFKICYIFSPINH